MRKPLEQRAKVIHGNNPVSLDASAKAMAAGTVGGTPAALSGFALGMFGPRSKAQLAIWLEQVRHSVQSGLLSADEAATMTRQVLGQGGRLEETVNSDLR